MSYTLRVFLDISGPRRFGGGGGYLEILMYREGGVLIERLTVK